MALWAIVPVKPLRRGKSRLAEVFTQEERVILNRHLLSNTLDTLKEIKEIEHVLVVSRDPAVLSLARGKGARTVQENGDPGLNIALERATIVAKTYSIRGVLIIPADLPLITTEDIFAMLERAKEPPAVVVAPDRHHKGTNAMLVCPAGLIEYEYGPNSFARHCELAREVGARLEICELPSIALDLDMPDDLDVLESKLDINIY
ncbi:MAG: 2-phospho-L-lactate guanylyltransferase [Anaerolineales bacterium]|nr:2-phospho-L-lactate guanylyltransferase [Anaerolineales bacterium]